MGMFRETLAEGEEGAFHLGPELPRVYSDLSPKENDRFVTAVKLNRGLRDSNYDQMYAYLKQQYAYLKQHEAHANENKMMLDRSTQHTVNPLALMSNVSHQQYYSQSSTTPPSTSENGVALDEEQLLFIASGQDNVVGKDVDEQPVKDLALNVDNVFQANDCDAFDSDYVKDNAVPVVQSSVSYVPTDAYMMILNDMHEQSAQHISVTTQNNVVDNSLSVELVTYKEQVKLYERRAKFELIEREQKINEQLRIVIIDRNIKEENLKKKLHSVKMQLSSSINHNKSMVEEVTSLKKDFKQKENKYLEKNFDMKALKEKALTKEIKEMKEIFKELEAEVDQHVVHRKHDEIGRKNLFIANDNLIADCLSKDVFYTATDSVLTVSRFYDMHEALNAAQKRIVELEFENSNLQNKIQNDDHDVMVKHFSKLEVEHLNLQLKYQHIKESFENKKSVTSSDAPTFDSVFVIGQLKDQVQSRGNTIHELREKVSRLTKKHSDTNPIDNHKALDYHNKELHAKVNALHDINERWRITESHKSNCVTMPALKPKVLAPCMYVIDVEPIPPRNRNNMEVHLDYLKHLKESVATLREIVKEARVEKSFDNSLASACRYTKHSQELEKQVTFMDPCETSTNNTLTHVKQQTMHQTNEPAIPSTGVKSATAASGSKPKSNTKKDKTLPTKRAMQKVEVHPRNNKSNVK
nr:integrase, catalytic region, zinc finger, CCHC-type, peptidase aspartic, catalytic [Tanacetum cinerariifolium]